MASSSGDLAGDLGRTFQSLNRTRLRLEQLSSKGLLTRRDCAKIYEALFINAHTALETFLEDAFLLFLVGPARSRVVPRVRMVSHAVARELVMGPGRSYADWIPYDKT